MKSRQYDNDPSAPANPGRRKLLEAAGGGVVAATLGGLVSSAYASSGGGESKTLRWGIVGTGSIANSMAPRIKEADGAELGAVSSRKMETAMAFAGKHAVPESFDSWEKMIASDTIDAVYIATPTSVREEIGVAAARAGKHVLGEKPFANLASLQRIVSACRENGVGFMDGTHFPHLPRTRKIRGEMGELAGRPWSVASAFQFGLRNRSNIRLRPSLEPYGAIGDAGWYNMRAAVEFLPDDVELLASETFMKRDSETNAAISGSGVMRFSDGSTSTWNCGFDSGAVVHDLRISGPDGVIWVNDFVFIPGSPAQISFKLASGRETSDVEVPYAKHAAALMFEDFAAMVDDAALFESSVRASERTQAWLDAAWESAVSNEKSG